MVLAILAVPPGLAHLTDRRAGQAVRDPARLERAPQAASRGCSPLQIMGIRGGLYRFRTIGGADSRPRRPYPLRNLWILGPLSTPDSADRPSR